MNRTAPPVFVALDFNRGDTALDLARRLRPDQCGLKVGNELFVTAGPDLVRELVAMDYKVFLDLKFNDIPNTVAAAVDAAANLGVWMTNIHASGGLEMMKAAVSSLQGRDPKPLLTAVTVLTSMNQENMEELGINRSIEEQVFRLASMAADSGVNGVVCSALEATLLKEQLGENFVLVTPGIRPTECDNSDQKRVVTPKQAIDNGAHYLVMGRPITRAADPLTTLLTVNEEISYKP